MQQTPKALRLHIGIFGRRNVGKSSIINSLTAQQISIVSDVAGTTTDPVEKAMELQPIGPVLFVDTAGVDDVGALGQQRVDKTMRVVERVDVALIVTDSWQEYEQRLFELFRTRSVPAIIVANKCDLPDAQTTADLAATTGARYIARTSATTGEGIDNLRRMLIEAVPEDFVNAPSILADLVAPGELIMLVVPIDIEAPKGRLILPQVQTLREILDCDAYAMVVKERELGDALGRLITPPALVITDSQEFLKVAADVPKEIPLTSFSILFSRFKGDLTSAVQGAMAIDTLKPGDKVLLAEGCTHHPTGEDIGRVKIPRWLEQYVGGQLEFSVFAGHDFPDDISQYRLIIHCGACVLNRRLMLSRIERARQAGVPLTNYGLSIAYSLGIFERALTPFPYAYELFRATRNN
jgi:[FeFe] hydrogenase H-cluster maturation GTPase HydF